MGFNAARAGRMIGNVQDIQWQQRQREMAAAAQAQAMARGAIQNKMLEQQATTATQDFDTEQAMRAVPTVMTPAVPAQAAVPLDAAQQEGPNINQSELPAQAAIPPRPDMAGTYDARAAAAAARGNPDAYMREQAKARLIEQEGVLELAKDVYQGNDPKAAVEKYNQKGRDRINPASVVYDERTGILRGERQGPDGKPTPFTLNPRKLLLKPEKPIIVPDRSSVYDPNTGAFRENVQGHQNRLEEIDRAAFVKQLAGPGGEKDPAKLRELDGIIQRYPNLTKEQALKLVYNEHDIDIRGKVLSVFKTLKEAQSISGDKKPDAEIMRDSQALVDLAGPAPSIIPPTGAPSAPVRAPASRAAAKQLPLDETGGTMTEKLEDGVTYDTRYGLAVWNAKKKKFIAP